MKNIKMQWFWFALAILLAGFAAWMLQRGDRVWALFEAVMAVVCFSAAIVPLRKNKSGSP